jgi:hypothetical protein
MTIPELGARVRLKGEPRLGLLVVVGQYLENETPWVLLQRPDGKGVAGPKIPRPVADLAEGEVTP